MSNEFVEICTPVARAVAINASVDTTGNLSPDLELSVIADPNTQALGSPRISVDRYSIDDEEFFNADSMMAVAVRTDGACRVVGGHGSAEYTNMKMTGERNVQSVRNAPKFFVRPIVRSDLGDTAFKEAQSNLVDHEQDLVGQSSHLVWDYYLSTGSAISPHDQTIIGYPEGILKVQYTPSTNVVEAYTYDFESQSWSGSATIATGVSNVTTFENSLSEALTFNVSPSGFYEESSGYIFICFTQFNVAKTTFEHHIYRGTPGGSDWKKISSQMSGIDLDIQRRLDDSVYRLGCDLSGVRFSATETGILGYFEVEFVDGLGPLSDWVNIPTIFGNQIVIQITPGYTTVGTVIEAVINSAAAEIVTVTPLVARTELVAEGTAESGVVGISLDSFEYEWTGGDYDLIIPGNHNISEFTVVQNRTRLVRGEDRWMLASTVVLGYESVVSAYVGSPISDIDTIEQSREFYHFSAVYSYDNGISWEDIGAPKMTESPSPLERSANNLIAIQSAARKSPPNLFDFFDFAAQESGIDYIDEGDGTGYLRIGRNPYFAAYYDEVMGEFVIMKRADGLEYYYSELIGIRSDGSTGRWRPTSRVRFQGENIDTDFEGDDLTTFEVSDCQIVAFDNDMNYLVLDGMYNYLGDPGHNGLIDMVQVVAIPFKFFCNRDIAYNAEVDAIGRYRTDRFVYQTSRDYTLIHGKFAGQLSAVVPNMAAPNTLDSERFSSQYPIACSFQDQLLVEFEGVPSNGRMFGITQQWIPWYETTPYQNVEIGCIANNPIDGEYVPDDTFWDVNSSSMDAVPPIVAGRTMRFQIEDGDGCSVSSNDHTMASGVSADRSISDTFKCRFSIQIISTSGTITGYVIPLVSCKIHKDNTDMFWLTLRLRNDLGVPKIQLWDQNAGAQLSVWTDDDFDPTDNWQFFMYAHAGGVPFKGLTAEESEARVSVFGRKVTTGLDGRWRQLFSVFGDPTPAVAEANNYVEWGVATDGASEGPVVSGAAGLIDFAYYYFSHSFYVKSAYAPSIGDLAPIGNPFIATDSTISNVHQYGRTYEGLTSTEFSEDRFCVPPFGRKCRSSRINTPFGYSLSFEGSVTRPANFLIGNFGEKTDTSDLLYGSRYKQMLTSPLVETGEYTLDLRFANLSEEIWDYIAFVNCELYDFDVNFAAALGDEATIFSIEDCDLNYEEYNVVTVGQDFLVVDTTDDLLSMFDSARSFAIAFVAGAPSVICNVAELGKNFIVFDSTDSRYIDMSGVAIDSVRIYRKDFIIKASDLIAEHDLPNLVSSSLPNFITVTAPSAAATGTFTGFSAERKIGKIMFLRREEVSDMLVSFEEKRFDQTIQETLRRRFPEALQLDRKGFNVDFGYGKDNKRLLSSKKVQRFASSLQDDATVVLLRHSPHLTQTQSSKENLVELHPTTETVTTIELTSAMPSHSIESSTGKSTTFSLELYEN